MKIKEKKKNTDPIEVDKLSRDERGKEHHIWEKVYGLCFLGKSSYNLFGFSVGSLLGFRSWYMKERQR